MINAEKKCSSFDTLCSVFAIIFFVLACSNFSFRFRYKKTGQGSGTINEKFNRHQITQQVMDNFLSIVEENSAEEEINESRLKYFTSKIKIWDYFNQTHQKFVLLSTEERSSMLKRYHFDLNSKYLAGKSLFFVAILLLFV